jgi:hypothetical protein
MRLFTIIVFLFMSLRLASAIDAELLAIETAEKLFKGQEVTKEEWLSLAAAHPEEGISFVFRELDLVTHAVKTPPQMVDSLLALEQLPLLLQSNEVALAQAMLTNSMLKEALNATPSDKKSLLGALPRANTLLNESFTEELPREVVFTLDSTLGSNPHDHHIRDSNRRARAYRRAVQLDRAIVTIRLLLAKLANESRENATKIDATLTDQAKTLHTEDRTVAELSILADKLESAHRDRVSRSQR